MSEAHTLVVFDTAKDQNFTQPIDCMNQLLTRVQLHIHTEQEPFSGHK